MKIVRTIIGILGIAATLVVAAPKEGSDKTAADKVQLVCGPNDSKVREAAQATLDAAWVMSEELLGSAASSNNKSAALYLDSSIEEYEKAEEKLTAGRLRKNLAFTHANSRTAHVALQPPCSSKALAVVGLPILTRHLVAHEAFHLAGFSLGSEYASLPDWIKDGAASYVDSNVLTKNGWSDGPEQDPFSSTNTYLALQLLKDGKLPTVSKIMHSDLDALQPHTRYGVRWLFFRFLQDGPRPGSGQKLIRKLMHAVKESPDASDQERSRKFDAIEKEYATLDDAFVQFLHGLKPQWKETFRSLDVHGKQWRQLAFPDKNALAWHVESVGQESYELTGQVRILPGHAQQMNLLIGESDEGFVSIAFVAGSGVTVFRYRSGKDEWEQLAATAVRGVALDKKFDFRVQVSKDEISVSVNKKNVVTVSVGDYPLKGPWGTGAQAGSAGIWSQMRCKAGSPDKVKK